MKIEVLPGKTLDVRKQRAVLDLFDQSYRDANHAYLLASFDVMRFIALAWDEDKLAGFAVGDARETTLPRMAGCQVVAMAGIASIDPSQRRSGLFGRLAISAIAKSGLPDDATPHLFCGRMAHAASYRALLRDATNAVPMAGKKITAWQGEVLEHVAGLYASRVDVSTARIIGKGKPIGFPLLNLAPTTEEEQVFASVDRNKGDSILAMTWRPEPPEGWLNDD